MLRLQAGINVLSISSYWNLRWDHGQESNSTQPKTFQTGAHFTNDLSIVTPIRLQFHSTPTHFVLSFITVIAMIFCTWYDSCVVVACTTFCGKMIPHNRVTLKPIFHRVWIAIKNAFMKWAPWMKATTSEAILILTIFLQICVAIY